MSGLPVQQPVLPQLAQRIVVSAQRVSHLALCQAALKAAFKEEATQ